MGLQEIGHGCIAIFVLCAVLAFVEATMFPGERDFHFEADIAFPQRPDTVSNATLLIVSCALPLFAVVISLAAFGGLEVAAQRGMSLGATIVLVELLTNIGKNTASRPRPDFLDRCFPHGSGLDHLPHPSVSVHGIPQSYRPSVCVGDPNVVAEGLKSWPSGHASLSAAGMTWLALFVG